METLNIIGDRIQNVFSQLPVNFVQVFLKISDPRFPGIAISDIEQGIPRIADLVRLETVLLKTLRNYILICYIKLLQVDLTRNLYNFHTVQKRTGNSIQRIGGNNKEYLRDIEGKIQVVVPEGIVLLRVQYLKEGTGGIPLVT